MMIARSSILSPRRLFALLTFIGALVVCNQAGEAAGSTATARQDVTVASDSGDALLAPADPVIEEPLRPLFPGGRMFAPDAQNRCGSVPLFLLPVGLLLMQAMRVTFSQSTGRAKP